jgi:hypothetical protein
LCKINVSTFCNPSSLVIFYVTMALPCMGRRCQIDVIVSRSRRTPSTSTMGEQFHHRICHVAQPEASGNVCQDTPFSVGGTKLRLCFGSHTFPHPTSARRSVQLVSSLNLTTFMDPSGLTPGREYELHRVYPNLKDPIGLTFTPTTIIASWFTASVSLEFERHPTIFKFSNCYHKTARDY